MRIGRAAALFKLNRYETPGRDLPSTAPSASKRPDSIARAYYDPIRQVLVKYGFDRIAPVNDGALPLFDVAAELAPTAADVMMWARPGGSSASSPPDPKTLERGA